jgi:hypothetical protein
MIGQRSVLHCKGGSVRFGSVHLASTKKLWTVRLLFCIVKTKIFTHKKQVSLIFAKILGINTVMGHGLITCHLWGHCDGWQCCKAGHQSSPNSSLVIPVRPFVANTAPPPCSKQGKQAAHCHNSRKRMVSLLCVCVCARARALSAPSASHCHMPLARMSCEFALSAIVP